MIHLTFEQLEKLAKKHNVPVYVILDNIVAQQLAKLN